jgi:hypothetical protein
MRLVQVNLMTASGSRDVHAVRAQKIQRRRRAAAAGPSFGFRSRRAIGQDNDRQSTERGTPWLPKQPPPDHPQQNARSVRVSESLSVKHDLSEHTERQREYAKPQPSGPWRGRVVFRLRPQSWRKARKGSKRQARIAGILTARIAATNSTAAQATTIDGAGAEMPASCAAATR